MYFRQISSSFLPSYFSSASLLISAFIITSSLFHSPFSLHTSLLLPLSFQSSNILPPSSNLLPAFIFTSFFFHSPSRLHTYFLLLPLSFQPS
jgi:hypothetical protein